jgi:hypothetical protein
MRDRNVRSVACISATVKFYSLLNFCFFVYNEVPLSKLRFQEATTMSNSESGPVLLGNRQFLYDHDARAPWRLVEARPDESLRWEATDGRWIAIAVGYGASAGMMLVMDSLGRCEAVERYEDALVLAKSWRCGLIS